MIYPISFCTFVKDEEDNILKMFNSIFDIVKEIIVIDTGSIDSTIDIIKLVKKRFEDSGRTFKDSYLKMDEILDFASIRNSLIEQASEEWILMLDGDEELCIKESHMLQILIDVSKQNKNIDAWYLPRRNYLPDGSLYYPGDYQGRFFKNIPVNRYVGRVHEHLIKYPKHASEPHIEHYHFLKPKERRFKAYRLYDKIEEIMKESK